MARRKRPVDRGRVGFRDDFLYVIASEDKHAVKQYFDSLRIRGVQVKVLPTEDGRSSPEHVVGRVRDFHKHYDLEECDEIWVFLDVDHYFTGAHTRATTNALQQAKTINAHVAFSNPCFELWLLLHHANPKAAYASCDAVGVHIREVMGGYNKARLVPARYSAQTVAIAVNRGQRASTSNVTTEVGSMVHLLMSKLSDRLV